MTTKKFCLLLVLIGFIVSAKADTIAHWTVYLNKRELARFSEINSNHLTLYLDSLKKDDNMCIYYYSDTPCPDCRHIVQVEDSASHIVASGNEKEPSAPLYFPMKDLIEQRKKNNHRIFDVFYFIESDHIRPVKQLLFRLKID